jgi:CRISPR-associated protein Csm4
MQTLRFTLRPRTAFGTPLVGDTLFGQLCWALRYRFGEEWLNERLAGYTEGHPFLVVSNAFPQGFLPLPTVPTSFWNAAIDADRKLLKKKRWLAVENLQADFRTWQSLACDDTKSAEAVLQKHGCDKGKPALQKIRAQPHNSINRATVTTDKNFTPYTQTQYWFPPEMRLDLYAVIDETSLAPQDLGAALVEIGQSGYGRDASIGLGKFIIERDDAFTGLPHVKNANAFLTLAPCAPQGQGFVPERSFYQILTRFGRHGDVAVYSGNPFKRPLLLAKAGSVFSPETLNQDSVFIGQGLGGVSLSQPDAVAQGYAPVMSIRMEES